MIIISVLTPILFVLLLGYLSSRHSFLLKDQITAISKFVFYLCIPALLFTGMATANLEIEQSLKVMQSFYLPVFLVFGLLVIVCLKFNYSLKNSSVLALTGTYSNTVLIGLPIVIFSVGQSSVDLVFIIITFHSVMLFSLTYFLSGNRSAIKKTFRTVLLNPIVLSLTLGILVNLLRVPLPDVLIRSLKLLSEPAIAGAIFVLGGNLYFLKLKGSLKQAVALSCIKLFLLPALVYVSGKWLFMVDETALTVAVLLAAAPVGVNAFFVSIELKSQSEKTANTVIISTLGSGLMS